MFTSIFETERALTDVAELRALFGGADLYLAPGARLTLHGEITLGPGVIIAGDCRLIGPLSIEAGCHLTAVVLGARTRVRSHSVLADLTAGEGNLFGPFCFIRDGGIVGDDTILGAHVEAARSRFGSGVKVSHRAFIGDAQVGERTILGAGVVFCNFDGTGRQETRVGADVTVGSGTMLVPPLTIGDGALIAAGSVVTKAVAPGAKVVQKR